MKETAGESADLKMALKHDPCTSALRAEAEAFPEEAGEAIWEVEQGHDTCVPGSWVAAQISLNPSAQTPDPAGEPLSPKGTK